MPIPNMSYRGAAGSLETAVFDEGLRKHMLSVYNYMGLGLFDGGRARRPQLNVRSISTASRTAAVSL